MPNIDIMVVKGKGTVAVDTDAIPEAYYKAALAQGLKVIVNGGMSKITKETYPDAEELKAKAMEIAQERVTAMLEGKLKLGRTSAVKGPSGAIMTEARRIARQMVKDLLRKQGLKVSHYDASEITRVANEVIEADPDILKMAEANIAERTAKKPAIDVGTMKADPKLVEKAEAAKVAKKANKVEVGAILSAKQAGKVQPRAHH